MDTMISEEMEVIGEGKQHITLNPIASFALSQGHMAPG